MTVAGDIVANLTANTKGWSSGLKDAITPLTAFASTVAATAVAGIYKFNQIGSAISDMSERTGVSAEALGGLRYAASQTDTSMESLQAGLVKQGKFMHELAGGSTAARDTIARLGVTTGDLATMTADERFLMFADKLARIEDVGERAALAMQVFGKGAIDLVPLLSLGAEGITELTDDAARLGLIMSAEDVAAADKFGNSLERLVMVGESMLVKFVAPLIPLLTLASDTISKLAGENDNWVGILTKTAIVITGLILTIKGVTLATQAYAKAHAVAMALGGGPKAWFLLAAGALAAGFAYGALTTAFDKANAAAEVAEKRATQVAEAEDAEFKAVSEAEKALKTHTATMDGLRKQYDSFLPAATQTAMAVRKMGEDWLTAAQNGAPLALTFAQLRDLQAATILKDSGFAGMFTGVADELRVLRGEITETELKFQHMAEFGVSDGQIGRLRGMMSERDKLLTDQKKKEDADKTRTSRIDSTASMVTSALETPLDQFLKKAKLVEEAIRSGDVTSGAGSKFLSMERQKLLDSEAQNQPEAVAQRKAALTEAISVRSDAGNRQLVELLNRKGTGKTIEDKTLVVATKHAKLTADVLTELKQVRANTAQGIPTKPWGGRA